MCSVRGRLAGASALGAARLAAQFPEEVCAGATAAPKAVPEVNGIRCSTGPRVAPVGSNPPSEPTPTSSTGGILARGTRDSTAAGVLPPEHVPFPAAPDSG